MTRAIKRGEERKWEWGGAKLRQCECFIGDRYLPMASCSWAHWFCIGFQQPSLFYIGRCGSVPTYSFCVVIYKKHQCPNQIMWFYVGKLLFLFRPRTALMANPSLPQQRRMRGGGRGGDHREIVRIFSFRIVVDVDTFTGKNATRHLLFSPLQYNGRSIRSNP